MKGSKLFRRLVSKRVNLPRRERNTRAAPSYEIH